jgi:type IV secretory pathway VirD2 relaxase
MTQDDSIKPKFGKIRSAAPAKATRFLGRVARAASKAGQGMSGSARANSRASKVNARSLIKGAGHGGGARVRGKYAGQRRVVIKARIVRIAGRGLGAMRAHLKYIERDGVTRDGDRGQMYGAQRDDVAAREFAEACEQDRHQFRFIVAPEDGARLEDLKPFVRDLMAQVEKDLCAPLDWVAVDHFNTGHPHSHIVLRGKTDKGDDLVIARAYISHGLRARAEQLLTLELGPKSEIERVQDWAREITAERFTGLDRKLLQRSQTNEIVLGSAPSDIVARTRQDMLIQRLRHLETMDLASETSPQHWVLQPELDVTLRRMGERGDILKTMHRAMHENDIERDQQSWNIDAENARRITGRIVSRGLSDEYRDRQHLIVDGIDGKAHYVDVGATRLDAAISKDAIVEIIPAASAAQRQRQSRVQVRLLSSWSLEAQASADGATWLDQQLLKNQNHDAIATTGFGGQLRAALQQRQRWLIEQGLAEWASVGGQLRYQPGLLQTLRQRDLTRTATALAQDTGMDVNIGKAGDRLSGTLQQRLDLASGRFAVIDQGRSLTIAPWSPALESARNRQISGVMIGTQMRWSLGKDVGLEIG